MDLKSLQLFCELKGIQLLFDVNFVLFWGTEADSQILMVSC